MQIKLTCFYCSDYCNFLGLEFCSFHDKEIKCDTPACSYFQTHPLDDYINEKLKLLS